jgi:hypothetical protein
MKHFPLGIKESSRFIGLIRILFGITCIIVAFYWLMIQTKASERGYSVWLTVVFLFFFGLYLIWAGMGKAYKFIEFDKNLIRIKSDIIFPPLLLHAGNIKKIDLYPLNVVIFLTSGTRKVVRFGATYYETTEKIKDAIIDFANDNNIDSEIIEEKF